MLKACVVFLFLSVTLSHATKLPPFFSKCKKGDSNLSACVLKTIQQGYNTFKKGNNEFHIQSVSPLKVPNLFIDVNGGLIINITDATITGFDDAEFTDVKIDLDKKEISLQFKIDSQLRTTGHYDVNGRILILPIQGNGPLNVSFVHPDIKYDLSYDLETQGGKEYIALKKNHFSYTITRAYFDLQNLFNGNEQLGIEMLKFLNENWKEVDQEIGAKLAEGIGEVLQQLLANFFKKVPYNELLDD